MKNGSITVFCTLCMMLIASVLFVLLEVSRVYGLDYYAGLKAETGLDSVCAEFHPFLWQQYGLLFLDGAYGTEQFSLNYVTEDLTEQIEENLMGTKSFYSSGLDLFRLSLNETILEEYALATDENGELFLTYIAERMKENLPLGIAEDLYEQYQTEDKIYKENSGIEESITNAQKTLENRIAELTETSVTENEEVFSVKQIWNQISSMDQSGILKQILGDLSAVSEQTSKPESNLQTRKKVKGNMQVAEQADWYRKLLVLTYLEQYFSNYTSKKEEHYLDYEIEYVLCGKDTEWENLEATFRQLLLIREAGNVVSLLQDREKMQVVEALAKIIGIFVQGNSAMIKVFEAGIIGAWAYLESVLDVRAIVSGNCIPFIKSKEEWTTDTKNILTSFQQSAEAKKCERGMYYIDYLKQFLFFLPNEDIAYRMMEVMEIGMQSLPQYQNCRMDQMIVAMKYQLSFESNPLFFSLAVIGNPYEERFQFIKEVKRSYIR